MKITYDHFMTAVKTKTELSTIIQGLWLSRSVIGVKVKDHIQPIFGFSGAFDRSKSGKTSTYELLEHLVFLPYAHNQESLAKSVMWISDGDSRLYSQGRVEDFLIGSKGQKCQYYGNGCAIGCTIQHAISHAKRELLERHFCCEFWYQNAGPIAQEEFTMDLIDTSIKLNFYTANVPLTDGEFAIATLEDPKTHFFALGAAIRSNKDEAYIHAASEVIMIFEDAKKNRGGAYPAGYSQQRILSLREIRVSKNRKTYFDYLIRQKVIKNFYTVPHCQTIVFEALPNIFAARTFSKNALDPRYHERNTSVPILPLF